MSKLIKALSVGTLILPIILCIIAMCHKFDYGRIVIDTVLLLTAIVGLRVVFHQLKIKEIDLVFKGRQIINDFAICMILALVCALAFYLCVMAILKPELELYQIPAFYWLLVFAFRMNHKAVFANASTLYYDFKKYDLSQLKLLEERDDGGHAAFRFQYKKKDFWIVTSHREGKKFQGFLKGALK